LIHEKSHSTHISSRKKLAEIATQAQELHVVQGPLKPGSNMIVEKRRVPQRVDPRVWRAIAWEVTLGEQTTYHLRT
jgi:hypothetical protein